MLTTSQQGVQGTGKVHEKNDDTKTAVVSLLATPFDPLGGLAPFVLLARQVMKETHILGLGWKDKIPEPLMPEWHDWADMTKRLSQVRYPRYVLNNDKSEYHIFGDASATMEYGVVVYVRTPLDPVKEDGKYHSQFLYAKSKINPKKEPGTHHSITLYRSGTDDPKRIGGPPGEDLLLV